METCCVTRVWNQRYMHEGGQSSLDDPPPMCEVPRHGLKASRLAQLAVSKHLATQHHPPAEHI